MNVMLASAPSHLWGLFENPLVGIGASLTVLLLLISAFRWWRQSTRLRLERAYRNAAMDWEQALSNPTRDLYEKMRTDPESFLRTTKAFEGLSKTEYDKARQVWSLWLAQRQAEDEILQQARVLYDQHRNRPWWQPSLAPLKKALKKLTVGDIDIDSSNLRSGEFAALAGLAPATRVTAVDLPQAVRDGVSAAQEQFTRFETAIKTSRQTAESIKMDIGIDLANATQPSLEDSKKRLTAAGLPLDPYQERINDLATASEQFYKKILPDPLSDCSTEQRAVRSRITQLKRDLENACQMQSVLAQMGARVQTTQDLVESLRANKVPSGLPGVEVTGNWTLDEEGTNPDPFVQQGRTRLAELTELLKEGRLIKLERAQEEANEAVTAAAAAIEKIMAEKKFVENEMAAITASSLPADIQADKIERDTIAELYRVQQWKKASIATQELKALHEDRKSVRLDAMSILDSARTLGTELHRHARVVSEALIADYRALVQEANERYNLTKTGRTDWSVLRTDLGSLSQRLSGEESTSIAKRLEGEIQTYNDAISMVVELRNGLQDVETKLAQNWGGEEAVRLLAEAKPAVMQVLSDSAEQHQNWSLLRRNAQAALLSLAPSKKLVDAEVARDQTFHQVLMSFNTELENCRHNGYTRTICGETFGVGVYCPVDSPTHALAEAQAKYEHRQYDEMLDAVHEARTELAKAHLEAWWMCLQSMSMSGDPCAQQFAWMQGFADGRYEQWMQDRLAQCQKGEFYNPPAITCDRHKPGQFPAPFIGDNPTSRDYAGGAQR